MENKTGPADVIILNAILRSMVPGESPQSAIAIRGGKIVTVGAESDLNGLRGPRTRVLDANGALILPGFNDAHVHFMDGGFSLSRIDLRHVTTPEAFARGLGDWAGRIPDGEWVLGGDWDHEKWPDATLPTRWLVDPYVLNHPLWVSRLDGHMGLANTKALQMAGITRDSKDPAGGMIVRDPSTGEPTGILKDAAQSLVTSVIPKPSKAQKRAAALAATTHAASLGVTSVTDVSGGDDVDVYLDLARSGELKTRIYAARPITTWEVLGRASNPVTPVTATVRTGAIKGFADGSLGSTTALFLEPYADDPGNKGILFEQMFPDGVMLERALGADKAGFQLLIHAIGDAANRIILAIYEEVAKRNGSRDRRARIEHAQHLDPSDIGRFGREGVIASVQPYHAADDGCWCEKRIGAARCRWAYPFRSLLESGAVLAFGSDWTVAPLDPLPALKAAVTRQTLDGRNPKGWVPEEKLTMEQAVRAYTWGSAYAEFAENVKGTLAPGMMADLVMLDRDIFALPADRSDKARVLMTMMDGNIVYERAGGLSWGQTSRL